MEIKFILDCSTRFLSFNTTYKHSVRLSPQEMKLLLLLSDNNVHTHDDIYKYIEVKGNALARLVNRIREKSENYMKIQSVSKVGYQLVSNIYIDSTI